MNEEIIEKYILAGKIASDVKKEAKKIVKEGAHLFEIAETLENLIFERGGKLAFPINLSINEIAAHYTPIKSETIEIKPDDVLKVDVGVHIDGYIADTALTINPNKQHEKLISAVNEAVANAIKIAKIGTRIGDIGSAIQKVIDFYGFKPVRNLGGHFLEQYQAHTGEFIPNIKSDNNVKLKEGDVIAIEPFATTGSGLIKEGKSGNIYMFSGTAVRNKLEREVLKRIIKESRTLPFTPRWFRDISDARVNLAISQLLKHRAIQGYPILKEVNDGLVAQAEHTILILEKPIVTSL